MGENGAHGPIYNRAGKTKQDIYYLSAYDTGRDGTISGCTAGKDYVVKAPNTALDSWILLLSRLPT